jgi:hypothetical protein
MRDRIDKNGRKGDRQRRDGDIPPPWRAPWRRNAWVGRCKKTVTARRERIVMVVCGAGDSRWHPDRRTRIVTDQEAAVGRNVLRLHFPRHQWEERSQAPPQGNQQRSVSTIHGSSIAEAIEMRH